MEGISPMVFWGLLLWYLAVLVCAMISLVAFGLLLAPRTTAARIVFAAGLLCPAVATLPVFLGLLGPLVADFRSGENIIPWVLVVLAELSLLLAGFGQFIASLRSVWAYAVALACALGTTVFVAAAELSESDFGYRVLGGQLAVTLTRLKLPLEIVGLLLAVASLMSAIRFPSGAQQTTQRLQK